MKKTLAFLLLAVTFIGSCRKDSTLTNSTTSTSSTTTLKAPAISGSALTHWFTNNPMGKKIIVDWSKAKQLTVGSKSLVEVPIKQFLAGANLLTPTSTSGKSVNDVSTGSGIALTTFDPYHPPALFFYQDKAGALPDSVQALLMNFVPNDPTKEDGARNVWTGNLMEWDMQSTTAHFQHLTKSMPDGHYDWDMIDNQSNDATSKTINSIGSKQSTSTVKVTSIFSDIWDALGEFFST